MTPDDAPRHPRVAGLLLAAGGGRRLGGRPKALLRHDGGLLVERAALALREAGCARVHVVLGAGAEEVRAQAGLSGCVLVDNPRWGEGMGSSLRAGLRSLVGTDARGVLVSLVDQPGIGHEAYARVLDAFAGETSLVSATYDGRRNHPVLLGSAHWAGVAAVARGDQGAREYLRQHSAELRLVECGDVADPYDIDTGADLGRLRPGGAH
ncbi:nucleotidyltransferase family protein [Streptomyces sp. NRRL F-2799]|uniref:nucleotidyltransferase family protein n=1 Tax=Streptomyces sp. NRRL F-2799 TaxID=1463844 RepID=UPI0004C8ACB9|nr:nucleotidyltransferase family protein [Streptomyces sp. NRRL F-2799]